MYQIAEEPSSYLLFIGNSAFLLSKTVKPEAEKQRSDAVLAPWTQKIFLASWLNKGNFF